MKLIKMSVRNEESRLTPSSFIVEMAAVAAQPNEITIKWNKTERRKNCIYHRRAQSENEIKLIWNEIRAEYGRQNTLNGIYYDLYAVLMIILEYEEPQ